MNRMGVREEKILHRRVKGGSSFIPNTYFPFSVIFVDAGRMEHICSFESCN